MQMDTPLREIKHFLYCPFTGLGRHGGYRGDQWLRNRIRIFKQYTLPSIQNQTNQNFTLWISWRPQDLENHIVEDFGNHLEKIQGLNTIFTYGGLCFWDDTNPQDNLLERLERTLPALKEAMNTMAYSNHVLMTIYPSDDMYVSSAVEDIQFMFEDSNIEAYGYEEGYIMNYATKDVAEFNPRTNPPFYTIKFDKEIFADAKKHFKYTGPYWSHEHIGKHLKYRPMHGRGFVVGTHGENISTYWDHMWQGKLLNEQETERVLLDTGTLYSDPIVIRKGWRLSLRKLLNRVPYNHKLHSLYRLIPKRFQYL